MTALAVGILAVGSAGIVGTIVVLVNGFACDLWNKENEAYKNCVAKTGGTEGCGSNPASNGSKPQGCDECGKAK
jgi:hypothetical protein